MPKQNNKKATINRSYKPTDKEEQLRKNVYERKHQMEQSGERQKAEKEWLSGEKAWDAVRSEREEFEWESNYYVPLTSSVIESILAEMSEQTERPLILPRGHEDAPKAKVMENAFVYSWEVGNGDDEMENVYKGGLIHGTTIGHEYYLKDRRYVRDVVDMVKKGTKKNRKRKEFVTEKREVFEFDDPIMEWVSPWDVLVDEKANEFNRGSKKARDCIRKFQMHYDDAKEFFEGSDIWDHLNNFRYVKPGKSQDYYQYYDVNSVDESEDVEVLWYWSRTPEDLLVIVVNDVVVRMGPNIYKHKQLPFAKGIDVKRLGKFYGKGEPQLLDSVQDEVNTLRRMIVDRHHLDIDKMFVASPDMPLDEEDVIARPHGVIPGNPADVKPVEYNDIPLSVQATLRAINEDKIGVTGVDDRFQSVQKNPSTATEAAILKESTLKRIRMKLRSYEKGFLTDIGRMRVSNILQFYSQPKLERIIGEKGTQEYKMQVADFGRRGLLEEKNGEFFKKSYKNIRMEGKKMFFDERGEVREEKEPGFHFFELRPEFFIPSSEGGYDIKFEAGPSLPVSKPLMQSKISEMYDRLLPAIQTGETAYDMERIMDELVKANELNPEDLKKKEVVESQAVESNRLEMMIELASQENQMILDGDTIPPAGTPYASPAHTMIHIEFLKSDVGKSIPEEKYMALLTHVQGESMAISQRQNGQGQETGATAQAPAPANAGGIGQGNQNAVPALVEGGNQVPTGRVLGNG